MSSYPPSSAYVETPMSPSNASSVMRENWIRDQLTSRIAEYSEQRLLHILCATWNVNAKRPSEDLAPWLTDPNHPEPDVYVIGFQEIVDLNAGNLLVDHNAAKPWEAVIERTLMQKYQLIASKQLVGLCLCVYVRRTLSQYVTNVCDDKVGVGIMGVGGNKGAVAIRVNIFDTSFCFVNSHLAAHQHNTTGRNNDYHNICARLSFKKPPSKAFPGAAAAEENTGMVSPVPGPSGVPPLSSNGTGAVNAGALSLFDHENVFWVGDLNYRLTLTDLDHIFNVIDKKDYDYLLQHDQLLLEKASGNAFKEWQEGPITFAPTYKYQPGSVLYERRPDKKKRSPAWCDRIQWIGPDVTQHFYKRAELCISDHKPVSALFSVPTRLIIPSKQLQLYNAIVEKLESWENLVTPKLDVSEEVEMGEVCFDTPITRTITLRNVGQVMAKFFIAPKKTGTNTGVGTGVGTGTGLSGTYPASSPASNSNSTFTSTSTPASTSTSTEGRVTAPWLNVWPQFGLLPPEQSLTLTAEVKVTKETAMALVAGEEKLEDILIVQVEGGKTYHIRLHGTYVASCFGLSLNYLANITTPVRLITPTSKPTLSPPAAFAVPKELWRLVDAIVQKGLDTPGLFITNGIPQEIVQIRECLDRNMRFNITQVQVHSFAECLLRFLSCLFEPVFPAAIAKKYSKSLNLTEFCNYALTLLPTVHFQTFVYLISFLREVLKKQAVVCASAQTELGTGLGLGTAAEQEAREVLLVQYTLAFSQCIMHVGEGERHDGPRIVLRHFLTSPDFE